MRILVPFFAATGYFLDDVPRVTGGAETGVELVAREWAKQGHEVHLVCHHPQRSGDVIADGVHLQLIPGGVERGHGEANARRTYQTFFSLARRLRPDLIYQAGTGSSNIVLQVLSTLLGIPYVLRLSSDKAYAPEFRQSLGSLRYLLFRRMLRSARGRIVQTHAQGAGMLQRYGLEAVRIPNGVAIPDQAPQGPREEFIWVGRIHSVKRPGMFLELARRLPRLRFRMIAPGYGNELEQIITAEADQLPNLILQGATPAEEVRRLMGQSRGLLCTSEFEGFPNVFLEANAEATPVFSLRIDPDGYIHEHGCGVVCETLDEMEQLLHTTDEAESRRLGALAREVVSREYELSKVASHYIDYFHSLIG